MKNINFKYGKLNLLCASVPLCLCVCILFLMLYTTSLLADPYADYDFVFAVLKYGGGGDWYSVIPAVKNFIAYTKKNTDINIAPTEKVVSILDDDFFLYPFIFINGHENIKFTDEEASRLNKHLTHGGFLLANDDYGLYEAFKREMKKVFPDKELVEVPFSHPIYHTVYNFPNGLPKIHEHYEGPPKGLGIFYENRLVVFFAYNSDIGDGWEKEAVYKDPDQKRIAALHMGINIIFYAMMY